MPRKKQAPKKRKRPVWYVGVDPGKDGGISIIEGDEVKAIPLPDTEWNRCWLIRDLLNTSEKKHALLHVCIERVHSRPRQSAQSGFTFGRGVGLLMGAFYTMNVSCIEVLPKTWQKDLPISPRKKNEPTYKWKKRLLEVAQKLFPSLENWEKGVTMREKLAVADSLLIANYCRRIYK